LQRRIAAVVTTLAALGLVAAAAAVAPTASAEPTTPTKYPKRASTTRYHGAAFDTCQTPTLAAMTAWSASPYRATAIYLDAPNRYCAQPNLTADWVNGVTAQGWKVLPVYVGLQAPCADRITFDEITASKAAAQGKASATEAITSMTTLGFQPGSIIYADMESYDPNVAACRRAVLGYLGAFTKELHRRGYLSGVYATLGSGTAHLTAAYPSTVYARPDVLWLARWDGKKSMVGFTGVPKTAWSAHQRAKQYQGDHTETYGGVTIRVDSNWVDAPVGTVASPYVATGQTNARTAPKRSSTAAGAIAAGAALQVTCQTPGTLVNGTKVWNKLSNGTYVSDYYVNTPSVTGYSSAVPRCYYPYQVKPAKGTELRTGAGAAFAKKGTLPAGALAWTVCQKPAKKKTGSTKVWDRIDSGRYVTDYHVASASKITYSPAVPRC
jgi:hypothetical protein